MSQTSSDNAIQHCFRLKDSFLQHYREHHQPDFGFGLLGRLTYERTYARPKSYDPETGFPELETWHDTIQRVVEGTFSMLLNHCEKEGVEYDLEKTNENAEEMYDRFFCMKCLPPGRGLWAMGTDIIYKKGLVTSLNNCFAHETEIITKDGTKKIGDLAGQTAVVLSRCGKWVEAPITCFGEQRLWNVTLMRQGVQKQIYATADHRWFAKSKADINQRGWQEIITKDLKCKSRLQTVFGQGLRNVRPSPQGIAHGIVFGDGSSTQYNAFVYLCGAKGEDLIKYFCLNPSWKDEAKNAMYVADLPHYYKKLPSLHETKSYLYGFMAGYFAANGSAQKNGQCKLACTDEKTIQAIRDICYNIGVGTYGVRKETRISNLTNREFTMFSITFMMHTLPEEFFLMSHHKKNFQAHTVPVCKSWNVVSVEETDRIEPVYCATVEGHGCFALADNILTGNCAFVSSDNLHKYPTKPFEFLMDSSMLGVGVGFDTKGAGQLRIVKPDADNITNYIVDDSREGWVESVRLLLDSYLHLLEGDVTPNQTIEMDYRKIRPKGQPLKTFGGQSSGPGPLIDLHDDLKKILDNCDGKLITSTTIVDIMNLIGRCVVSGNLRRCLAKGTLVCTTTGLIPIESVQKNDWITMPEGEFRVQERYDQGLQSVIEIHTENDVIKCTRNHRLAIWTNDVTNVIWKQAGNITTMDNLVSCSDKEMVYQPVAINQIIETDEIIETYDLEIDSEMHAFAIGSGIVVHNSAEIAFGEPEDDEFLDLKNYEKNPHRASFAWASNNSILSNIGMNYHSMADQVRNNGEPGFAWLETMRQYGRLVDPPDGKDYRVAGGNPCLEQSLESFEMCTLVETFLSRNDDMEDFLKSLKYAYLYAKVVTLGDAHWPETREVMRRNRRIGCSVTGVAQFLSSHNIEEMREWFDNGYKYLCDYDRRISEWLKIPESVKRTSVKPSGSISLLGGATPGVHYPQSQYYIRRVTLPKDSKFVVPLMNAGYVVEESKMSPKTSCIVEIPVAVGGDVRTIDHVSMWEQLALAAFMQRHWADNQVSCTVTFDPELEGPAIPFALDYYQYQLKGISFLPRLEEGAYPQMPYETITKEEYERRTALLKTTDPSWDDQQLNEGLTIPWTVVAKPKPIVTSMDAENDLDLIASTPASLLFCDGDKCIRI